MTKTANHQFQGNVVEENLANLPSGDVLIQVEYSSLNYKDALSATGNPGVTKKYPHIPGIDAAGKVVRSDVSQFKVGDSVLVTGFDLGMNTWGGFSQYIQVPGNWVLPLPDGLTSKESMILGTAGLTAALCVDKLRHNGIQPESGEILVTGATGGVGSLAIAILAKLGYEVVAATGKYQQQDWLLELGAKLVISRQEIEDQTAKPLLSGRWASAVDTVGGNILATVLKSTQYGGCVTSCGLVGGANLNTTVYPFILRGVSLVGIDSVQFSREKRREMWQKLADDWKPLNLEKIYSSVTLEDLSTKLQVILAGGNVGRLVLDLMPNVTEEG